MKKIGMVVVTAIVALTVSGCGFWAMNQVVEKKSPVAKNSMAVLVIARTTSYGFAATLENYLDGNLIGQTKGKCYFLTDVTPGEHWVTSHGENTRTNKINFESGKVYYLQQAIYMGFASARTEYDTLNPAIFEEQKPECEFLVFDPAAAKDNDLLKLDMKEALAEREEQMKDEAAYFQKVDGLKGF